MMVAFGTSEIHKKKAITTTTNAKQLKTAFFNQIKPFNLYKQTIAA